MTDRDTLRRQLGQAIRQLRMARDLTAEELAQRMGKQSSSARQISRWELGRHAPGADQLFTILLALDMSFADLHQALNPAPASNPRLEEIARRLESLA